MGSGEQTARLRQTGSSLIRESFFVCGVSPLTGNISTDRAPSAPNRWKISPFSSLARASTIFNPSPGLIEPCDDPLSVTQHCANGPEPDNSIRIVPPLTVKSMARGIGNQFRHDHAELPAPLRVHVEGMFDEHELDSPVVQPGAPDRLAERANVVRCIDDRAIGRHLKSPMHARIVVQKARDAGQCLLDFVAGRTRGDQRDKSDHGGEFVIDPVGKLPNQKMVIRVRRTIQIGAFHDIHLHLVCSLGS